MPIVAPPEQYDEDKTLSEILQGYNKDRSNPERLAIMDAFLNPQLPGAEGTLPTPFARSAQVVAEAIGRNYTYGLADPAVVLKLAREPFRKILGEGSKLEKSLQAFKNNLLTIMEKARKDFPEGNPDTVRTRSAKPKDLNIFERAERAKKRLREEEEMRIETEKREQRLSMGQALRRPGRPANFPEVKTAKRLCAEAERACDALDRAERQVRTARDVAEAALNKAEEASQIALVRCGMIDTQPDIHGGA